MTGAEMYLTTRPARKHQNSRNHSPVRKLSTGTSAIASAEPRLSPAAPRALPTMTAGIASTPTTNCGELVSRAKHRIGSSEPYSPYTGGSPAIWA